MRALGLLDPALGLIKVQVQPVSGWVCGMVSIYA